jgi:hypothetical protein
MSIRGRWILEKSSGQQTINHIECGVRYVALCGESFAPDDVDRVAYEAPPPEDLSARETSHETFCYDCVTVKNRRRVERAGE